MMFFFQEYQKWFELHSFRNSKPARITGILRKYKKMKHDNLCSSSNRIPGRVFLIEFPSRIRINTYRRLFGTTPFQQYVFRFSWILKRYCTSSAQLLLACKPLHRRRGCLVHETLSYYSRSYRIPAHAPMHPSTLMHRNGPFDPIASS